MKIHLTGVGGEIITGTTNTIMLVLHHNIVIIDGNAEF